MFGPRADAGSAPGVRLRGELGTHARAHFRSEAARLVAGGEASAAELTLRGTITQCSYPGGFYRYAVEVGERRFLVDDRLSVADFGVACVMAVARESGLSQLPVGEFAHISGWLDRLDELPAWSDPWPSRD